MDRVEQLKIIQGDALELFTRKNADYGDAFAKYGIIGVLVRIEDKIQRVRTGNINFYDTIHITASQYLSFLQLLHNK